MDADAEAEAVEHGHDREHLEPVDGGKTGGRNGLQTKGVEVHIGKENALRRAGRAARVEDRSAVFGLLRIFGKESVQFFALAEELLPPDVVALALGVRIFPAGRERIAKRQMREELVFNLGNDELCVGIVELRHDRGNFTVELVEGQNCFGF